MIERTIGTVLAGASTESQHVADADPDVQAPRQSAPESRAVDPAELFHRAVDGRDAKACCEWLRRFANWDPGEE